jgi:hypothetical protein
MEMSGYSERFEWQFVLIAQILGRRFSYFDSMIGSGEFLYLRRKEYAVMAARSRR